MLSEVVNGDKFVLDKLDEQINVIDEDEEDDDEDKGEDLVEYKKVSIDYQGLTDKDSNTDDILKDLLDLPVKNRSKVFHINIQKIVNSYLH